MITPGSACHARIRLDGRLVRWGSMPWRGTVRQERVAPRWREATGTRFPRSAEKDAKVLIGELLVGDRVGERGALPVKDGVTVYAECVKAPIRV